VAIELMDLMAEIICLAEQVGQPAQLAQRERIAGRVPQAVTPYTRYSRISLSLQAGMDFETMLITAFSKRDYWDIASTQNAGHFAWVNSKEIASRTLGSVLSFVGIQVDLIGHASRLRVMRVVLFTSWRQ
jgi:hypothetical protein